MASQHEMRATTGGEERIEPVVQVLAPAFQDDPVYAWLLLDVPGPERPSARAKLLRAFFTQGSLNDGAFIEVGDFGCCGLLMPPGSSVENTWTLLRAGLFSALWNVGLGPFKRGLLEYAPATEPSIKKTFTKEEQKRHWYVFIMGTAVDRRRQGLAGWLIAHMQARARGDGRPLWLEATTQYSRDLYAKHGFTTVDEVLLGKGKVDAAGLAKKGGEGFKIWSMYWRP
ncbi:hypothetical protein GGR56DRAFT_373900 [Xylariaceae sp. FL0804]|nr:hypothetical protein GGR56DRAFT_373900 [Xylariaceae sp. FL0804]